MLDNMIYFENYNFNDLHENHFEIVSKVGYLIGVKKKYFKEDGQPGLQLSIYNELEKDRNIRIVHDLCVLRTQILLNFRRLNEWITRHPGMTLYSAPNDLICQNTILRLEMDNVNFIQNGKLCNNIIAINRLLSDKVNLCKNQFETFLNWDYVKQLVLMANGNCEAGTKVAANNFYSMKASYPYQTYIGYTLYEDSGNILFSDRKFCQWLYEQNGENFNDDNFVSGAGRFQRDGIAEFINTGNKVALMVDCENSDPYMLVAALNSLEKKLLDKIERIVLVDDVKTSIAWDLLDRYTSINIEHIETKRLMVNKSNVDMMLATKACHLHYMEKVESFMLASSDSDFMALIQSLPDAKFLILGMEQCMSPNLKNKLEEDGIFYCYLDDFYNTGDLKKEALFLSMEEYIIQHVKLNLPTMLDTSLKSCYITMTTNEKNQFYHRYIKNIRLEISPDGDVQLKLKRA